MILMEPFFLIMSQTQQGVKTFRPFNLFPETNKEGGEVKAGNKNPRSKVFFGSSGWPSEPFWGLWCDTWIEQPLINLKVNSTNPPENTQG